MTRLEKLYLALETFKKEGLEFNAEQEAQLRDAEEDIIRKEILPVITEKIAPLLSQIKREIVLVVDSNPEKELRVNISRKVNFKDFIPDVVEIKPDPIVTHRELGPRKNPGGNNAPKTTLRVTMPDGKVIVHNKAKDTFIDVIKEIGVEKVRAIGLKFCKIPIVSNRRDEKYGTAQHPVDGGWLILTHSSTADKKKMLDRIANALHINMMVEII